jgi:hypothetical protein
MGEEDTAADADETEGLALGVDVADDNNELVVIPQSPSPLSVGRVEPPVVVLLVVEPFPATPP